MTVISTGRMILKRIHGWHPTAIGRALIRATGEDTMPSFKDADLEQQKKDLVNQIDALEEQIDTAPEGTDTSAQEQQLEQLEQQLQAVHQQRKDHRTTKRDEWKAGKGKDPAA